MRRRTALTAGGMVAPGSTAGCFEDDGEDSEPTPTTEAGEEPAMEPGEDPSTEGVTFSALAGSSQLDHSQYLGDGVGADTRDEVDNRTRHKEGARLEMNDGGEPGQEGFRLPPRDLVPGAVEEGWVLFETDTDTTKGDLQVRCGRNDIRATWE